MIRDNGRKIMQKYTNSIITCILFSVCSYAATAQQLNGRVDWIYQIPSNPPGSFIGVGTDGTIYVTDNLRLYSLAADGSLNWTLDGVSGGLPITFGQDGIIYTSTSGIGIAAVSPEGSLIWEYTPPQNYHTICGPNVDPNGNIYAVQERLNGQGHGMYAVDSQGNLLWNNTGDPPLGLSDLGHANVVFGSDRLYTGIEGFRGGYPSSYCFSLDGNQIWYSGLGDLELPATSFPEVMPDQRVAYRWGQIGVMVIQPDGQVDWIAEHPDASFLVGPAIGNDGVIYSGNWLGLSLWAVNPDGTTRWTGEKDLYNNLGTLAVAPDNSVIIATGSPGWVGSWVRGYNPVDGEMLWQVDIPYENGKPPYVYTAYTAFSPDSHTAYITIRYWDDTIDHSYLYAIDISNHPGYNLAVTNLAGGSNAVFTITNASPLKKQILAYSLNGFGSTWVPQLNVTLNLQKPQLLDSGFADTSGMYETVIKIPQKATGHTVWFQGAEYNSTTNVISDVVK